MDRNKVIEVQAAMVAALKKVAEEHGMKLGASKVTYFETTLKFSVEAMEISGDSSMAQFDPALVTHLTKWGRNWGLTTDMLGTEFEADRGTMIFHGTRGTSTKYLIAAVKATGDKFRYPIGEATAARFIERIKAAHAAKK